MPSGRRGNSRDGDDKPNTGRPGKAPAGNAGKHPWTSRPPQGWGRAAGGPAGKKPPKK